MDVKKGILGTLGAGVLAVGGFIWQNGGQDVAATATKQAVQQIAPEILDNLPDPFKAGLLKIDASNEQAKAFQQAYEQCHDATAQNPKINLNDVAAVYDANVQCLLVDKNQGFTLDKMAEQDAELKQTLIDIRQKLSPK